jgi:hypothetical protein
MTSQLICAVVFVSSTAVALAQTTAPPSAAKKNDPKLLTITGCIGQDPSDAGNFTLADSSTGSTTYRLTGTGVQSYLGKRVSVTGAAAPAKVAVRGGLMPSPNVAAQAGAIDPTRAAMAAQGAEGNTKPGSIVVPELRVKSMKLIEGGCEQR